MQLPSLSQQALRQQNVTPARQLILAVNVISAAQRQNYNIKTLFFPTFSNSGTKTKYWLQEQGLILVEISCS